MSDDQEGGSTVNNITAGRDAQQYNFYGDYHEHGPQDGWTSLSEQINADALHDAASRLSAKCHPKTRKAILQRITLWLEGQTMSNCKVLWLHGSVGLGKSAIAETIARIWRDPSLDRYTASYFFPPRQERTTTPELVAKTIIYQLGLAIPALKKFIVRSLVEDPVLLKKAVEPLLEALIIGPLTNISASLREISSVIIIDGLDHCSNTAVQMDILKKIIGALRNQPVRFLITSRPEQHLREAFNDPTLAESTARISLDRYPGTDDDIRLFLQDGFTAILQRRADIMRHLPMPWPEPSTIDHFVSKASGQFLYATTVLGYVDASGTLPTDQLKTLMSPTGGDSFSGLDELYTAILNACHAHNRALLNRILTLMTILHCPQAPEVYEDLLGVRRGMVSVTLSNMHSIVRFPNAAEDADERAQYIGAGEYDSTQGLRLRHENFRDFLENPARSGEHALKVSTERKELIEFAVRCILVESMSGRDLSEDLIPPSRETWGYLKEHLHLHLLDADLDVLQGALDILDEAFPVFSSKEYAPDAIVTVTIFYALGTILTTLANMLRPRKPQNHPTLKADHSHWSLDVVLADRRVDPAVDMGAGARPDEIRLPHLYERYSTVLAKLYCHVLQSSPTLCELLPALLVSCSKRAIPVEWLRDMFGDSISALWTVSRSTRDPVMHQWSSPLWTRYSRAAGTMTEVTVLNAHFVDFISTPERCGQFYQPLVASQAIALRQILKRVFSPAWLVQSRSSRVLSCLDKTLRGLLVALSEPATSVNDINMGLLLKELVAMDYCVSCYDTSPASNVASSWQTMLKILRWLYDRRQQVRKHAKDADLARLYQTASDNMYRQILSVDVTSGRATLGLIKPLLDVVASDHLPSNLNAENLSPLPTRPPVNSPSSSILVRGANAPKSPPGPQNHVSDSLLLFYGVRHSIDSFLKSPDRAGLLHVDANTYHTQLAEISLHYCLNPLSQAADAACVAAADALPQTKAPATGTSSSSPGLDENEDNLKIGRDVDSEWWSWRHAIAHRAWSYHLERAQPTSRLLSVLRKIPPGDWLVGGVSKNRDKANLKSVEVIVKWLKNLDKQPVDLVHRWETIHAEIAARIQTQDHQTETDSKQIGSGSQILHRKTATVGSSSMAIVV